MDTNGHQSDNIADCMEVGSICVAVADDGASVVSVSDDGGISVGGDGLSVATVNDDVAGMSVSFDGVNTDAGGSDDDDCVSAAGVRDDSVRNQGRGTCVTPKRRGRTMRGRGGVRGRGVARGRQGRGRVGCKGGGVRGRVGCRERGGTRAGATGKRTKQPGEFVEIMF